MTDRKPYGYWEVEENAVAEAKKVMEEHGFDNLPIERDLIELGYSGLSHAIIRYYGGFYKFRKLLGEEQIRTEKGNWQKLDYIIGQARKVMKKHGFESLPCSTKLRELGYSSLAFAITKYHGGFRDFRNLLGEKQKRSKMGAGKNLDYVIEQAKKVMEEHGLRSLPNSDKLNELGYSSLGFAIIQYHGGFHKFRKILGEEQKKREGGTWKSLDYTIEQAKKIMEENKLKEFPSPNKLNELGYSSLGFAISKYYGGFHKFRELLNQKLGIKSEKQQLENLLDGYIKQ